MDVGMVHFDGGLVSVMIVRIAQVACRGSLCIFEKETKQTKRHLTKRNERNHPPPPSNSTPNTVSIVIVLSITFLYYIDKLFVNCFLLRC